MAKIVIEAENLGKEYKLGVIGTGTISHDLNRWWARVRGKQDPGSRVGESHDKSANPSMWALRDVSFRVEEGDLLGIIGRNGAGKSTLLKILSQVTEPTTGEARIRGRIASLLEVGTGFHPDLTGRDNVFLNGSILGMTSAEIRRKFDEIVEFSGVEKFIDTPVKRYSSGMKVRLGFAVAAHLEPEILVVDEVLAVGDAEFQSKCLGKMKDVAGTGRTVLFVSHNLSAVRNLCKKGIVLDQGSLVFSGGVEDSLDEYRRIITSNVVEGEEIRHFEIPAGVPFGLRSVRLITESRLNSCIYEFSEPVNFELECEVKEVRPDSFAGIVVEDSEGNMIIVSTNEENGISHFGMKEKGIYRMKVCIPGGILKPGKYYLTASTRGSSDQAYQRVAQCLSFEVLDTKTFRGMKGRFRKSAMVAPEIRWDILL